MEIFRIFAIPYTAVSEVWLQNVRRAILKLQSKRDIRNFGRVSTRWNVDTLVNVIWLNARAVFSAGSGQVSDSTLWNYTAALRCTVTAPSRTLMNVATAMLHIFSVIY